MWETGIVWGTFSSGHWPLTPASLSHGTGITFAQASLPHMLISEMDIAESRIRPCPLGVRGKFLLGSSPVSPEGTPLRVPLRTATLQGIPGSKFALYMPFWRFALTLTDILKALRRPAGKKAVGRNVNHSSLGLEGSSETP